MISRMFYPTSEAMELIGIRKTTFWKMVKAGTIEIRRVSGKTVVPASSLVRLCNPNPGTQIDDAAQVARENTKSAELKEGGPKAKDFRKQKGGKFGGSK